MSYTQAHLKKGCSTTQRTISINVPYSGIPLEPYFTAEETTSKQMVALTSQWQRDPKDGRHKSTYIGAQAAGGRGANQSRPLEFGYAISPL